MKPTPSAWQITKLVPGGRGFLKLPNGQGAFAAGTLPDERIEVSAAEDHGGYLVATEWELVESSPERVLPACPVQSACGGCDWMMLSYDAQIQAKRGMLLEALERTGHFQALPEIAFVPAAQALRYRSRVRLHITEDGLTGYFAADSRRLVEIPACPVADAELEAEFVVLRALASEHRAAWRQFRELELRVAPLGPRLSLRLVPRDPSGRTEGTSLLVRALATRYALTIGEKPLESAEEQRFPLPGEVYVRAPAAAFTQVNWQVNQLLVAAVIEGVAQRGITSFCDLYCGAGNFSLPLLARGLSGVGIESASSSIAAAERAATEQGFTRARFVMGDVREALIQLPRSESFDLVLLDPPRAGAREVLAEIVARAPQFIAYCSCDPVTLARDLRALCDAGYALEGVTGFDMFPQTHHFESLAWLRHHSASSP